MSIESVIEAVRENRSLWVELECPDVPLECPRLENLQPVTDPAHCTVAFFGKNQSLERVVQVHEFAKELAAGIRMDRLGVRVGGVARFRGNHAEGDPLVLLVGDPLIRNLNHQLVHRFDLKRDWDYTPHVTLGRIFPPEMMVTIPYVGDFPWRIEFKSMAVCAGEARVSFSLGRPS